MKESTFKCKTRWRIILHFVIIIQPPSLIHKVGTSFLQCCFHLTNASLFLNPFSKTFFAIASSLSFDAVWMDSNSSCVWKSHKRGRMPRPAQATCQMPLHLHPSFQRQNPKGTYLSCIAGSSPNQPCLHGNWVCGYLACKPFPATHINGPNIITNNKK